MLTHCRQAGHWVFGCLHIHIGQRLRVFPQFPDVAVVIIRMIHRVRSALCSTCGLVRSACRWADGAFLSYIGTAGTLPCFSRCSRRSLMAFITVCCSCSDSPLPFIISAATAPT